MSSTAAGGTVREAIPSHNEEAEVATLGAVLIDPEALPAIIALVRPEDFYRGAHQRIFEAVLGAVRARAVHRPHNGNGGAALSRRP